MIYREGVFRRGAHPAVIVFSLLQNQREGIPYIFDTTQGQQMQAPGARNRLQGRHPVLCLRQLRDVGSDAPPSADGTITIWRIIVEYSGAIGYVTDDDLRRLPHGVRVERALFKVWKDRARRGDAAVYTCLEGRGRDEISFLSSSNRCDGLGRLKGSLPGKVHSSPVRNTVPLLRCNTHPKWRMTLHASECPSGSAVPTGLYVLPPESPR